MENTKSSSNITISATLIFSKVGQRWQVIQKNLDGAGVSSGELIEGTLPSRYVTLEVLLRFNRRYGDFGGSGLTGYFSFVSIDTQVHVFQVPGGMISNLANQLKERNALDRIAEFYKETPLVRKDLGYPPPVTPTSQIVRTQAVMSVLTGKGYDTIANKVKRYLQDGFGKAPAVVDSDLQKRAIGKEEVIDCRPLSG